MPRAVSIAPVPFPVGVVYFREPAARAAIVVKATLELRRRGDAWSLSLSPLQRPLRPPIDLLPRKAAADVTLAGQAHGPAGQRRVPIELVAGALRVSADVDTSQRGQALAALGPTAPPMVVGLPRTPDEAELSKVWAEPVGAALQIAPRVQRIWEPLAPGLVLQLSNLTQGGGRVVVSLPREAPYVLVARSGAAPERPALRCDALHLDATRGQIELTYRGEVDARALSGDATIVVGLGQEHEAPTALDVEAVLRVGRVLGVIGLDAPVFETRDKSPTQRLDAGRDPLHTVPLEAVLSEPTSGGTGRGEAGGDGGVPRAFGGWVVTGTIASSAEVLVLAVRHAASGVQGRLHTIAPAAWGQALSRRGFEDLLEMRQRAVHPGLLPVLDRGATAQGVPYVVEAAPRGAPLDAVRGRGPVGTDRAVRLMMSLLDAVGALHAAGVVHGSIGPEVVQVERDVATLARFTTLRRPLDPKGPADRTDLDPAFMSPEVATERWRDVDARADVWSLAALFVWLVTGSAVHRAPSKERVLLAAMTEPAPPVATLDTTMPAELAAVLDRALSTSPSVRFATAGELASALEVAARPPLADDPPTIGPRRALDPEDITRPIVLPATPVGEDEPTPCADPLEPLPTQEIDVGDIEDEEAGPKSSPTREVDVVALQAERALPFGRRIETLPPPPDDAEDRPTGVRSGQTMPPPSEARQTLPPLDEIQDPGRGTLPPDVVGPGVTPWRQPAPSTQPPPPLATSFVAPTLWSPSAPEPPRAYEAAPTPPLGVPAARPTHRIPAADYAAIFLSASPEARQRALEASGVDELGWFEAQAAWTAALDEEAARGGADLLSELLSALHAATLSR
jgi:serine/threonine-protein kinase